MKYFLLIIAIPLILAACSEHNSKEAMVQRQKAIKAEMKAADDSLVALKPSDTSAVHHPRQPSDEWALEEKRKPFADKKRVLQKEFDSLERELKKN